MNTPTHTRSSIWLIVVALFALSATWASAQNTPEATPEETPEIDVEATPEAAQCFVSAETADTAQVRVGPGTNRTSVTFLPAGTEFVVQGQAEDTDGALWYRLDKQEAAPGKLINEAWVAAETVIASDGCESVAEVEAPPIIPIVSGDDGTAPASGDEITVQVPASARWVDTNIRIEAGQTVTIRASGRIRFCRDCEFRNEGPAGLADPAVNGFVLVGAPRQGLIGRIGSSAPFFVGANASFQARSTGTLQLSINDDDFYDNAGAFVAIISVIE